MATSGLGKNGQQCASRHGGYAPPLGEQPARAVAPFAASPCWLTVSPVARLARGTPMLARGGGDADRRMLDASHATGSRSAGCWNPLLCKKKGWKRSRGTRSTRPGHHGLAEEEARRGEGAAWHPCWPRWEGGGRRGTREGEGESNRNKSVQGGTV